jgi:diaminopimelate decarboxylase
MHDFVYKGQRLHCEDVPVEKIAGDIGTPFYLYGVHTLRRHYQVFDRAFKEIPHIICYSAKANSNLAILRLFINEGSGLDIVSGGELYRALKAGADPDKIVYAGVGKTEKEIRYALEEEILLFNVESSQELVAIHEVASKMNKRARVALRINPDIDPKTHPYISTGLKKSKFGIDIDQAIEDCRKAKEMKHLDIAGVHIHIGSQITETRPFVDAVLRIEKFIERLRGEGFDIRYLDIGGGLGITYDAETPPLPGEFAEAVIPILKRIGCTVLFEPGRVIVGNAGVLITKVLYLKSNTEKNFVIVDAAMNDLMRPTLYSSYQNIIPIEEREADNSKIVADVVGPICESGDFLARERVLPPLEQGDLLAVMSAGAYGFSMSSNYNSRTRIAEVLVDGRDYHVIRERETYEDLIRGETIPDFLKKEK